MGKQIHKLRNIDVVSKKATCLNCGLVDISKTSGGWRCSIIRREEKRKENFKRKYGILVTVPSKPDICKLCNRKIKLSLDHDHKTNKIRGWICANCNSILGFANDDIQRLENIVQYLKDNK